MKEKIQTIEELHKELIIKAWNRFEGNKTLMAKALGISASTLKRKLHCHNVTDTS